jgi:hypothetical protein
MNHTIGWVPGRMSRAWAFQVMDRVFVAVAGSKPTPCYEVKLTEFVGAGGSGASTALEVALLWRDTDIGCAEVITPYVINHSFFVGRRLVETVWIQHDGGPTSIPVRRVRDGDPAADATAAQVGGGGTPEFTGWSRASFDEAYSHAVAQIPLRGPDDLLNVRVTGAGGMHGGIAGFDERFVTVRRIMEPMAEGVRPAELGEDGGCRDVTYAAEQPPGMVIINAYGEHPTGGWTTFFEQLPIRIWPPQFRLVCVPPSGPAPDVVTPFHARTCFRAAERVDTVIVHDAEGEHEVKVDQTPD